MEHNAKLDNGECHMKRLTCMASVLALLAAVALGTDQAGAGNTEAPSIKDVMDKLHKGANSPLAKLKKSLKAQPPNWKDIQDSTKLFAELGTSLPDNDPPKGNKDSFKKLAIAYSENAKALDDAARKENQADAQAAYSKLSTSCMPCHKDHRPPPG
jgi:cytochrome c556